MKVVILAGGFGSRISEESHLKPKPMIEIGEEPILWHIMKTYSSHGFNDFIICCGYKGHMIKRYFADYYMHKSDITFDYSDGNKAIVHHPPVEPWRVTLIDSGLHTMTGGRIKRIKSYIGDEPFMLTYGDGVSNIDFHKLLSFHQSHRKIATISMIRVAQRFGVLESDEYGNISSFREKETTDSSMINAGFMVLEPNIFDYINGDNTVFETEVLTTLANKSNLAGYHHEGFWQCMDTQRDKEKLEKLWNSNNPPWKNW